jgi:molecular chaperone GrpE
MRDRFVRLQAEWDNFRKRTAAEREQERIRAAERLVERLLPVVDDLERAIEHSDTANELSLKEGIAAVYSKLSEVLEREGLKTISPSGEPFDANLHQAVGKEDNANIPDETVTQVYQKGYGMGDRVLRPAMVVVSQGGPKHEKE